MSIFENSYNKSINVEKIIPNEINPNNMPKKTFNKLKASLKEFGQLNPIIVREMSNDKYQIIDGEWRWRASKEIGKSKLECKVVKASKEDVAKLILASTIKGKHDVYASSKIIEKILDEKGVDPEVLKAINLDTKKILRKTKYNKVKGIKRKGMKDETDSYNVKTVDKYKKILLLTIDSDKYDEVIDKLRKVDGNLSDALIKLLEKK